MPPLDLTTLQPAPPGTNLPPEAFQNAAAAYWEAQKKESASAASTGPIGIAAVDMDIPSVLLDAFSAAFEQPILQPVIWPAAVPVGHKLRSVDIFVKLWDAKEWNLFWELFKAVPPPAPVVEASSPEASPEAPETGTSRTYWLVIAMSAVDAAGQSIWPSVLCPGASQTPEWFASVLKDKYNGPKGLIWAEPLWKTAMQFNGLLSPEENLQAKNSDSTASSPSSVE